MQYKTFSPLLSLALYHLQDNSDDCRKRCSALSQKETPSVDGNEKSAFAHNSTFGRCEKIPIFVHICSSPTSPICARGAAIFSISAFCCWCCCLPMRFSVWRYNLDVYRGLKALECYLGPLNGPPSFLAARADQASNRSECTFIPR